jgi:hypothetical protein
MLKRYWIFNLIIACIAGIFFGWGNLLLSLFVGVWTFACASLLAYIILDYGAGKATNQDLFFFNIICVNIFAGIISIVGQGFYATIMAAFVSLVFSYCAATRFICYFGKEVLP